MRHTVLDINLINGIIFYDKNCNFCKKMIPFLNLDENYQLIDLNDSKHKEVRNLNIPYEFLLKEIHLKTTEDLILKGGEALLYILKLNPFLEKPLKNISEKAFTKLFFNFGYKLISKNRSIFNFLLDKVNFYSKIKMRNYLMDFSLNTFLAFTINIYQYLQNPQINYPVITNCLLIIIFGQLSLNISHQSIKNIAPISFAMNRLNILICLIPFILKNLLIVNLSNIKLGLFLILYLKFIGFLNQKNIFYFSKFLFILIYIIFLKSDFYQNLETFIVYQILFYTPSRFYQIEKRKNLQLSDFFDLKPNSTKIVNFLVYLILLTQIY